MIEATRTATDTKTQTYLSVKCNLTVVNQKAHNSDHFAFLVHFLYRETIFTKQFPRLTPTFTSFCYLDFYFIQFRQSSVSSTIHTVGKWYMHK